MPGSDASSLGQRLTRRALLTGGVATGAALALPPREASAATQSQIVTNVQDYGALGNGSADDAAAIQAAIDATPQGGTVWFPPGTYLVGATISLKLACSYVGSSMFGSVIKQAAGKNLVAVVADAGYLANATTSGRGVQVRDLTIDGNAAANTQGHGLVLMTFRSDLHHLTVQNTPGSGIVFSDKNRAGTVISNSAVENRVTDCSVLNPKGYGVWVLDTNRSGRLTDGYLLNNIVQGAGGTYAMRIERSAGWFIESNHVYRNMQSGYFLGTAWCTYFGFNETDKFGQRGGAGPYYGVDVSYLLSSGRPSLLIGNECATPEGNFTGSSYVYFRIAGDASGTSRATVVGNVAHNDPVGSSLGHAASSTGFVYQAQNGGTLALTEFANRSDGIMTPMQLPNGGQVTFLNDSPPLRSILARGDLFVGSDPGAVGRLPVGNDGDVLVADSSQPLGVAWKPPA
jgi:hypothetical protein